ncbi:hypothetical protein PVAND_002434 [Polypedilum vanderplanki]|uniref:Chitin-binding type-2 domain-containing protein n=1 Tax=Polypedilum vanderplanki TaxID=319348 RepID=A0A9J6BQZ4_POLVA|nr:hypothetical protein PVAND_002434 [Polypedilum vanderplanki]
MFQSIVRECPSGTIFPSGGNQCVPGDRSTCTVLSPTTTTIVSTTPTTTTTISLNVCEGINIGSIAIPGDCTRFILCLLGEGELISCGNNEVFDQTVGRCVAGNPLTCEVFTTTTLATTTTTTLITTTTSTSSTFPTTASSSTESTSSTQSPPSIGNVCTGNNFRFVANPRSCYRYFYCLFGVPMPGECGAGTIFNEAKQSCVLGDRTTCIEFTLL